MKAAEGRSRKGAWIEIRTFIQRIGCMEVAPVRERGLKFVRDCYEDVKRLVAPVRERGLKYHRHFLGKKSQYVAPVRERGLKYRLVCPVLQTPMSLP